MPNESKTPSFEFTIQGAPVKVALADPSKFIIRFTVKCQTHISTVGGLPDRTVVWDIQVDAETFDSPKQIDVWFAKGCKAAFEKMPGQLLGVTMSMLDRSLAKAGYDLGVLNVTPKIIAEHHAREYEHSVKRTLGMSGRGRRPLWSKEEIEQATRKAAAFVYRRKKYSAPHLNDIAAVFNKRFPDRGIFTANSVRQLLNRNGIRWRALWREIENAQK